MHNLIWSYMIINLLLEFWNFENVLTDVCLPTTSVFFSSFFNIFGYHCINHHQPTRVEIQWSKSSNSTFGIWIRTVRFESEIIHLKWSPHIPNNESESRSNLKRQIRIRRFWSKIQKLGYFSGSEAPTRPCQWRVRIRQDLD